MLFNDLIADLAPDVSPLHPVAHVAAASASFAGTVTTAPVDTTGATLLIFLVGNYNNDSAVPSDSFLNTWHPLGRNGDYGASQLFYAFNPTVGAGHTFTAVDAGSDLSIAVAAFPAMDLTSAVFEVGSDHQSASAESTNIVQAGSVTPATKGDLIIAGIAGLHFAAPAINSGFTITDYVTSPGGSFSCAGLAYLYTVDPGAKNPTWTAINSNRMEATIAVFKKA